MIKKEEYLKSKKIVEQYENEQIELRKEWEYLTEKMSNIEDIDLSNTLSKRAKRVIYRLFEISETEFKDYPKIYLSELVLCLQQFGFTKCLDGFERFVFVSFRGVGIKTYNEIVSHVSPFLKTS